jgi:toxin ParE1/3/4
VAGRPVLRRRRAEQDIDDQVSYYLDEGGVDSALRFLDAVDGACQRLQDFPEIGPVRAFDNPRLTGIRIWLLPDFDEHLVFYRVTDDRIEIVRILHAKRDIHAVLEEND